MILAAVTAAASDDGSWTLVSSHDGIDTYVNDVEHDGFKEFRGVADLPVSFAEARDVIKDIPGNVHWLPSCRRSELVREIDDDERLVYIVSNAPWPVRDRDCVWKRHYVIDTDDHLLLRFTATDQPYDGEEGLVRIRNARGVWEVVRIDDDTTRVSFQYVGDGGGTVPKAFVNATTRKIPEKALKALTERILSLR